MEKRIDQTVIRSLTNILVDNENMGRVNLETCEYGYMHDDRSSRRIHVEFNVLQTTGDQIHRIPDWSEADRVDLLFADGKDFSFTSVDNLGVKLVTPMDGVEHIRFVLNNKVERVVERNDHIEYICS